MVLAVVSAATATGWWDVWAWRIAFATAACWAVLSVVPVPVGPPSGARLPGAGDFGNCHALPAAVGGVVADVAVMAGASGASRAIPVKPASKGNFAKRRIGISPQLTTGLAFRTVFKQILAKPVST
jgi:hypothetical protein